MQCCGAFRSQSRYETGLDTSRLGKSSQQNQASANGHPEIVKHPSGSDNPTGEHYRQREAWVAGVALCAVRTYRPQYSGPTVRPRLPRHVKRYGESRSL